MIFFEKLFNLKDKNEKKLLEEDDEKNKSLNKLLKHSFYDAYLQAEVQGLRYIDKQKNISVLFTNDDISNFNKFSCKLKMKYDKQNNRKFHIVIEHNENRYVLYFRDSTLAGADEIVFGRIKDIIIDIRKSSCIYKSLHDQFKREGHESRLLMSNYYINGEFEKVDDIYFLIPDYAIFVELYYKSLRLTYKLKEKWSFYNYEYDDILYYRLEGDIDKKVHVSGGELTGGGYSLGKAALGYVVAGDVGAIIAGKEKISQTPINERTETIDNRKLNLYVYDEKFDTTNIINIGPENYAYLKENLPTKEYEFVLASGGIKPRERENNSTSSDYKKDYKYTFSDDKDIDKDIIKESYAWKKTPKLNESYEKINDNKVLEKYRILSVIEEIFEKENMKLLDGQQFGFTEWNRVVRLDSIDVRVWLISPKPGVDRYEEFKDENNKTTYDNIRFEAIEEVYKKLKKGLSEYVTAKNGEKFGMTSSTLIIRADYCDVQIKLMCPKFGNKRFNAY